MHISLNSLEEALGIRRQMDTLEKRLAALLGNTTISSNSITLKSRRRMSPAARAKIAAAAQRARWAKTKGGQPNGAAVKSPAKKGGITAAGRRRLSLLMKARWAKRRKMASKK
jgi:hypothetical protein